MCWIYIVWCAEYIPGVRTCFIIPNQTGAFHVSIQMPLKTHKHDKLHMLHVSNSIYEMKQISFTSTMDPQILD